MEYKSIDIRVALEQLGDSDKLYKTVVKGFNDRYSEVNLTIEKYLDQGEMEEARRVAHSMKGLCGNLGAMKLRSKALALETAIKEETSDIRIHLRDFAEELGRVNKDVGDILEKRYGLTDARPEGVSQQSSGEKPCASLMRALASYRFSEINKAVNVLKRADIPADKRPGVEKAISLIQVFEYERALILLKEVCGNG